MSGLIKQTIAIEFNKSSHGADCKTSISSDAPVRVYATKAFKTGAFKLVGLSNNISVAPADKVTLATSTAKIIGSGKDWKAHVRSSNSILSGTSKPEFFACYWAVHSMFDQAAVNCKNVDKTVEVAVLGNKYEVQIPILVNTAPIAKDEEIIALKTSEPTNKRQAGAARPAAVKKPKK